MAGRVSTPASLPSAAVAAAPLVYGDEAIRAVLSAVRTIAVVGASAKDSRPSFFVVKYLLAKGYRVVPVNPGQAGGTILGQLCHADLSAIPEPVDMVDIFRASEAVPAIVDEALALVPRPAVIWMQLGIRHEAAAAKARAAGLTVIMDRCPKIEYARLSGEIGWNGVNSRVISSKRPVMRAGYQSFGLKPPKG